MWSVERAQEFEREIRENPEPRMKYKDSRAVYDLKHMFETSVDLYGDNPAFWTKDTHDSPYRAITYKEAYEDVKGLATALLDLGLKRVAIIGANCYEWAMSYLGVTTAGIVVVPLDKELRQEEIAELVKVSEVDAVIYHKKSKPYFEEKIYDLKYFINMHEKSEGDDFELKELIKKGNELLEGGSSLYDDVKIDPNEMGILLFTSGTTGMSKGVMLSHGNICCDLMISPTVLQVNTWDKFFSVLPLHHTYACTDDFLMPIYKGASIAYCEGLKYIVKNLSEAQPTMFLGVPALFENFYTKIWKNARKSGKEKLLKRVIKVNRHTKKIGLDLGNIFFKQIRSLFGGKMRICISGGAAIDPEILEGFRDFGILALQGYGLTECAPICALNPDTDSRDTSAGFIIPGLQGKIHNPDEDGIGEFCTKGDNVMLGYYKDPEATSAVLIDGWFYTGDLGYIDEDNYVYVSGRIKNVIIAKNGKNVFPEELEFLLSQLDLVQESMVYAGQTSQGDDTTIVAGIYPDIEVAKELFGDNYRKEDLEKYLKKEIDIINEKLPFYKRIKKVMIRDEEFVKNTSKKIKRFVESNKEN